MLNNMQWKQNSESVYWNLFVKNSASWKFSLLLCAFECHLIYFMLGGEHPENINSIS